MENSSHHGPNREAAHAKQMWEMSAMFEEDHRSNGRDAM